MLFLSHLDHPFAASPLSPQSHSVGTETKNNETEVKSVDMTSSSSKIIDVPVEILVEVLKHLECRYILRCMLLSRFFRDIIKESLELQYIIRLSLTNQIDNPNCLLPTSTKLCLLLDRRERWKTLNWTSKTRVPLRGGCHAYELVGGVFAKSVNFGGGGGAGGSRHFVAALLPTRDSIAPCKIERQDLGVPARDFAIDPSQDLIALVDIDDTIQTNTRIQVHLRTISTNTPHKLARAPTLIAPIPFQIGACFIQIVKDVIGMFFWLHGPSLIIWNWRSGELLVVYLPGGVRSLSLLNGGLMGGGAPAAGGVEDGEGQTGQLGRLAREGGVGELNPGTWDFAFLSERAFMLTILGGRGSIYIYTFNGGKAEQERSGKGLQYLAAPRHAATLYLPALQGGQEIHHFSTHSAPFLGGDPSIPGEGRLFQQDSNGGDNDNGVHGEDVEGSKDSHRRIQLEDRETRRIMKPFYSSQENRVHLMSFHYGITGPRFHLFVKNDFLLGIVEKLGEGGSDDTLGAANELMGETRVKETEWEDWGPTNTRFLEHNLSFQWLRYCHGQRIVLPPIPDQASPHGVSKLCVIDFNVHPSRLDPCDPSELKREDLNSTYEIVKAPSIIRAGNLFKEDVQTWLPYSRATRVGMFGHYSGFMIDDERLVGMKASMSVAEGDLSDIDVFTF